MLARTDGFDTRREVAMRSPHLTPLGWALTAGLLLTAPLAAQAPRSEGRPRSTPETPSFKTRTPSSIAAAALIPVDSLSPVIREKVRKVISQPTLVTHANPEEFSSTSKLYEWLLDHPDRAATAWQRLGVECAVITDRGNGKFGWSDDQGGDIVWVTVANGPSARIWYAEGHVRATALTPLIPVKAVAVLRHDYIQSEGKAPRIRHQVDVFAHADSRAAQIVTRLFGNATDRMAEQGAEQLQLFFSMLAKHLTENPDKVEKVLAPVARASR